jgi:hypothetical protein
MTDRNRFGGRRTANRQIEVDQGVPRIIGRQHRFPAHPWTPFDQHVRIVRSHLPQLLIVADCKCRKMPAFCQTLSVPGGCHDDPPRGIQLWFGLRNLFSSHFFTNFCTGPFTLSAT